MKIPYITRKQITELDRLMVEHFKISVTMMMENAGQRIAEFVRQEFPNVKSVLLCCGKGNNGGDGIAAARYLLNYGFNPKIYLASTNLKKEGKKYLEIAKIIGIEIVNEIIDSDIIIDCLLGYNLNGAPRENYANAIHKINNLGKPIIACDVPSGVDCDLGVIFENYVKASHVLFLSMPKIGCKKLPAKKYVADIGVPSVLYPMINIEPKNYFRKESVVLIIE